MNLLIIFISPYNSLFLSIVSLVYKVIVFTQPKSILKIPKNKSKLPKTIHSFSFRHMLEYLYNTKSP